MGRGRDIVCFVLNTEAIIVSNKPPFSKQNLGIFFYQKTFFELIFTGVVVPPIRTDRMTMKKVMEELC